MQISITLDIATLNPSQFKAFTELTQSFREVYYIPESVVEPIAPTGSDITPPKRRKRKSHIDLLPEPGSEAEKTMNAAIDEALTSAYADLVQDVTAAITAGKFNHTDLNKVLLNRGLGNMPDLAQKLHLVPAIRVSLGL